ncbi:hypothetical protein MATR_24520 [Marivirga tractuosa]|uniref:Secreted protein n=1 Tax=Marivirga tractuosa (strain ATCC 23168 / DSM 4126 / NBRC 15989 / NCIMB 1408 / VKM B-1430 / H-43) TaxID=643867 RepID=E4TQJ9_MARTH|nr:hypothetical protein [Marivirga tractuosa]ADR23692.1 hypothetical protein Ftrac_3725 [Marivirga tractuosa DSM 4126]BDD15627.1 hypothetical protein MATR_24520 [Marivirga tractuosa]
MRKMKLLILVFVLLGSQSAFAQDYKTAVGFRGGFPTAITGKHFINKTDAIEGLLSGYRGGFELTGLYEKHANAFDIPYLNWYYGAGAHIGAFDGDIARPGYYFDGRGRGFTVGVDGIFGLEYTLTEIPFVIGVDIKPSLDFAPDPRLWFGGGLSFRFYF